MKGYTKEQLEHDYEEYLKKISIGVKEPLVYFLADKIIEITNKNIELEERIKELEK